VIVVSVLVFATLALASAYYSTRKASYRRGIVVHDDPTVQEPDLSFLRTRRWWTLFVVSGILAVAFNRIIDLLWSR
jgi:hypothetical protein